MCRLWLMRFKVKGSMSRTWIPRRALRMDMHPQVSPWFDEFAWTCNSLTFLGLLQCLSFQWQSLFLPGGSMFQHSIVKRKLFGRGRRRWCRAFQGIKDSSKPNKICHISTMGSYQSGLQYYGDIKEYGPWTLKPPSLNVLKKQSLTSGSI